MTTPTKAEQAAEQLQTILDAYHRANSENARFRSEVGTLRGKIRSLEALIERRGEQPRLPEPLEAKSSVMP